MDSQIVTVTVQAALFSALSSTVAQSLTFYQKRNLSASVDPANFLTFMLIAVITTPPNYLYQRWMEDTFPSQVPVTKQVDGSNKKDDDVTKEKKKKQQDVKVQEEEKLSVPNTVAKLLLDQSFGAMMNTFMFIVLIAALKGNGLDVIRYNIKRDFFPMLLAGYKVWPAVTLLNLAVVPFDYRPIVGGVVGVMWGVYINLTVV